MSRLYALEIIQISLSIPFVKSESISITRDFCLSTSSPKRQMLLNKALSIVVLSKSPVISFSQRFTPQNGHYCSFSALPFSTTHSSLQFLHIIFFIFLIPPFKYQLSYHQPSSSQDISKHVVPSDNNRLQLASILTVFPGLIISITSIKSSDSFLITKLLLCFEILTE